MDGPDDQRRNHEDVSKRRRLLVVLALRQGVVSVSLMCPECGLPVVPFGGEDVCIQSCDRCGNGHECLCEPDESEWDDENQEEVERVSVSYLCAQWKPVAGRLCDRTFDVNVARRPRFVQFHDSSIEYDVMRDCESCKNDGYGRVEVCAAGCEKLANDSERQEIKDERVAADRDAWVSFLRHCAGHGGYKVSY